MKRGTIFPCVLLGVLVVAGLAGGLILAQWAPSASPFIGATPRSGASALLPNSPTPFPMQDTRTTPQAAGPDRIGGQPTPARPLGLPPTPRPSDPYQLTIYGHRTVDTRRSMREATVVAIGTVTQVHPARWTTPDGRRPENPHAPTNLETIYTPVRVEVERYLKGERSESQLLIFALGGVVGKDSVEARVSDVNVFQEGQRVIVFLVDKNLKLDGVPLWSIVERYTLTDDGQAVNSLHSLPLTELLDEVYAALQPESD